MKLQSLAALLCTALLCVGTAQATSMPKPGITTDPATDPTTDPTTDPGTEPNQPCTCPAEGGVPVCGTNGKFYPHTCQMKCERATLRGECGTRSQEACAAACIALTRVVPRKEVFCYEVNKPVCAANGGIFSSDCEANAHGLKILNACGEDVQQCARDCFKAAGNIVLDPPDVDPPVIIVDPPVDPPACACGDVKAPVCGVSGKVHGNRCMAETCFNDTWRFDCPSLKEIRPLYPIDGDSGTDPATGIVDAVDWAACSFRCMVAAGGASCEAGCPPEEEDGKRLVCTYSGKVFDSKCKASCNQEAPRSACPEGLDEAQCAEQCKCLAGCNQQNYYGMRPIRPEPVCGASGQLWSNECELKCAADTPCENSGAKPAVCGWDGKLRPSACQAKCDGVELVDGVSCEPTVDAADDVPASCDKECAEAAREYRCQQAQCKADDYSPVCTTDGTVLNSTCLAECQMVDIEGRVVCSPNPAQAQECADRCSMAANGTLCAHCADLPYDPVCGWDGTFYRTRCEAECEGAWTNEAIQCEPDEALAPECSALCSGIINVDPCSRCDPNEFSPVCGTDGRYYRSVCLAKCVLADINYDVQCNQEDESTEIECIDRCLEAAFPPPYEPECDCAAPSEEDAPVCTYGGAVMPNACAAQCEGLEVRVPCGDLEDCAATCKDEAAGEELRCICDMSIRPVCGSDGVVYQNACQLQCRAKGNGNVMFPWPFPVMDCTDEMGREIPDCQRRCGLMRVLPVFQRPGEDDGSTNSPCAKCKTISAVVKVCGTSGKVHNHACFAECNRDRVRWACADRADCEADCLAAATADKILPGGCKCVELNQPVCAASSTVHPNGCTAVCKGDEPWFECGKLSQRQCNAACSAALDALEPTRMAAGMAASCQCDDAPAKPVCATSGTVYTSTCLLQCAKASKLWDCGKRKNCAADCVATVASKSALCIAGTKPVCATNGKVVANPCALRAAKLKKRWDCGKRKNCAKDCLAASKPVVVTCPKTGKGFCATNGSVYPNECLLKKAKATKRFNCTGRVDCAGDCAVAAKPKRFCGCKAELAPVCTRGGKLFTNACLAKCAKKAVRFGCGKLGSKKCATRCRAAIRKA